jgi:hypothetical protein
MDHRYLRSDWEIDCLHQFDSFYIIDLFLLIDIGYCPLDGQTRGADGSQNAASKTAMPD